MSKQSRRTSRACRTNRGSANERTSNVVECALDTCAQPAVWATVEVLGAGTLDGLPVFHMQTIPSCAEHADDALRLNVMCVCGPIDNESDLEGLKALADGMVDVCVEQVLAWRSR